MKFDKIDKILLITILGGITLFVLAHFHILDPIFTKTNLESITTSFVFSMITSVGVIYAILKGVESSKKDRNQDFTKMLADFEKELIDKLQDEADLRTGQLSNEPKCTRYSADYLNILDRIAYLRRKKMIDDNLIDYFNFWFGYGKLFLNGEQKCLGNMSLINGLIKDGGLPSIMMMPQRLRRTL